MKIDINKVYDRLELCERSHAPSFTDFLDLAQLIEVRTCLKIPPGYIMVEFSCFRSDERRMIGFFTSDYLDYSVEQLYLMFPVELLEIEPRFKTEPTYGHRDLLGSLLGLGIERRMFGDIVIHENSGYIICNESISHIVSAELLMVKRTSVNVTPKIIDTQVKSFEPKSNSMTITLASLRIDSLVKAVSNCSRNEAINLINSGFVKLNQVEVIKNHQTLHEGDILSVRTKGKFKLSEIGNVTKKGRISITVLKYI